jgi:hypothetical protein
MRVPKSNHERTSCRVYKIYAIRMDSPLSYLIVRK